ncbi:RNA polymerase-binding transcription factor DksA [Lyticum sinuosum]|uniref:RNA polymerase-binding transcription factor DksA n=2 Tax=Lyticum sinuosum TaxID=1332059 RepID=A0AAE4VIW8_9RICK|nr:TraR/DksA C4-type zinc finger protein [Lyticum sinuosum]MDZ5760855.1 RNA polymerase-binding transcription factor DksA [Lyticum sinuosum]
MENHFNWLNEKTSPFYRAIADIPNNYKPSEKEEYMCPEHREYFRKKLIAWKLNIIYNFENTKKIIKEIEWNNPDMEERVFSENSIELDMRTSERKIRLLERIDEALKRIVDNKYGYCSITDEPIGLRRLEARPIATMCIGAQELHEKFERNHNKDAYHRYYRMDNENIASSEG